MTGRTRRAAWIALAAALAALHVAAFWPGLLTWDAIRQYGQALSGRYDDWHPPAMDWLWRQLRVFGSGPGPFAATQIAGYWAGFAGLIAASWRGTHRLRAGMLGLLAVSPLFIVLLATVLKDSLMACGLLLAVGLMANARSDRRWPKIIAASLLVAVTTLRFNAAAASLPLLVALAPAAWRRTQTRLAITTVAALLPLLLALPLANWALRASPSGVELSLVIFDLGGITRFSGVDAFPPQPVDDPVAINADCYTPVSWDRYAWWGADPCEIGFMTLKPVLDGHATRWWLTQIAAHPIAYVRHRLAHFNANLRFWARDRDLPPLPLATDPNPWGYRTPGGPALPVIGAAATAMLATPLGWPACWIALGLGLCFLRPWREGSGLAWPVLLSALLYAASFGPLSVASEVRYHLWTELGIGIAAILVLTERHAWASRARLAIAAAPVLLVTALAIAARSV